MKPITVLSPFDGMSCGQQALERAGIPIKAYYASEIDKYAIKVTQANYPNTIQLGTVEGWKTWNIPTPDLILAGSPCQGFSVAGRKLNFEDPRSKLFFTFCDILAYYKELNPDIKFLLENVKMKKAWQQVITDRIGVEPVLLNSSLVSAQNRERLYWANWQITEPEDRHIYLKDIIEDGEVDREKSYTIDANYYKGGNPKSYFEKGRRQLVFEHQSSRRLQVSVKTRPHGFVKGKEEVADKYPTLAAQSPHTKHLISVQAMTERRTESAKEIRRRYRKETGRDFCPRRDKELVPRTDGKANCLTGSMTKEHLIRIGTAEDIQGHDYNKRVYSTEGKAPTLNGNHGGNLEPKIALDDTYYRKLTPLECERLQTVEEGYTAHVSNTQRYRMLGNGWTIEMIVHILKEHYANTTEDQKN